MYKTKDQGLLDKTLAGIILYLFFLQGFTVGQVNYDSPSRPSSGSELQVALQSPKELSLQEARKPKFLNDLEKFLVRELESLGVDKEECNETRLQVNQFALFITRLS